MVSSTLKVVLVLGEFGEILRFEKEIVNFCSFITLYQCINESYHGFELVTNNFYGCYKKYVKKIRIIK